MAGYYYHARLSAWRDVFAPDELVVRPFERSSFVDGSLYADFLDAAGIDIAVPELTPSETRSQSLDAETIEFLRILNLQRVEQGAEAWLINNLEIVERLRQHYGGPTLTLPEATLDQVNERWQESNRSTAHDFLCCGVLFREPRRQAGTTTEQRLDPARVDYFAALVGLPTDVTASLKGIVERESSR